MSEKNNALTLLAAAAKFAPQCNYDRAGKALNAQLALIREADPLIAKRACFVGTALLMVKESLAHGEFGPWLDKNIDDLGRRQVAYYMKLALAALNAQRIDQESLAALPAGNIELALTVSTGPAAKLRLAVEKFVGDSSLADLLAEHCGKSKGKSKGPSTAGADDAEAKPADPAQCLYNEAAEHLHALRITLTDDAALIQIKRKALLELNDSVTQLQKEFSAKVRTALGKTR